ncbi:vanin-like protein 1 [Coccinella septempunctata]|uniref:vanin-like protein 1 n=1 Tax=Coccinella septempunctata TaxID=41139 RepID=UPI001D064BCF|nr:vanin-like protein 1 [Coccinella septempunctata]
MFKCAFVLLISSLWLEKGVIAYDVALVEYFYDTEIFLNLSPLDAANRNAKKYNEIVGAIKHDHEKLDLVVFPEATLVAEPLDTPSGRLAMTFVPKAESNIIPCDASNKKYSDFFKLLSCTARKYRTYLVVNLKEKDDEGGVLKFYNTDVVFDRDGKVIARYRKNNLYLEPDTNRPKVPELVTFETDFGKTFGIFTCFDIIFESPPIKLVRKGVKNFIFPTLWIPELPFLTTNQVQQMWAQGNDVNLLASGAALPRFGSGGLGIYLGNNLTLAKAVTPRTDNFYLYEKIPDKTNNLNPACSTKINDKTAKEMDKYTLYIEDLTNYSYEKLDLEGPKTINKKLCQKDFCCDFKIEVDKVSANTKMNKKTYEYFMVIRNGLRTYGNNVYRNALETCGIVACPGPTIKDCGKRFPDYDEISWPISFQKISISGVFSNSEKNMQFPNSLLADFSPISPACTAWVSETDKLRSTVKKTFSTKNPVSKLLTFAIFGRNYAMDAN